MKEECRVIYISGLCSENVFQRLMETAEHCPAMCEQKYHKVMTQGICSANGAPVIAITALPVSRRTHRTWLYTAKNDADENANYHYLPVINIPVVKLAVQVLTSFLVCAWYCIGGKHPRVICDMLCGAASIGGKLAARLFGREFTGIITDIPEFLADGETLSWIDRMLKRQMEDCDSYVLLTEEMNNKINPKKRPYCVVEGQADLYAKDLTEAPKATPRVCMYAGAVERIYGLDRLAQAFSHLPEEAGILEIYGNGSYVEELKAFCRTCKNVRYMGLAPNKDIVTREKQAALLVNPRPSDAEYTKYSFPSKTMEYLASGTPVLTTRLPGIPAEYDNYLFYIDDESPEGIGRALEKVLNLSDEQLQEAGKKGQAWVLKEKNSQAQANKILHMWENTRN